MLQGTLGKSCIEPKEAEEEAHMKYGAPKIEIKWVLVPFAQGQQVLATL